MARKRLTQLFPFLLPLRIWQRNLFYQIGMKFDGNKYSKNFGEKLKYEVGGEEKAVKKLEKLQSYLSSGLERYQDIVEVPEAPEGVEYRNMGTQESQIFSKLKKRFCSGRKAFSEHGANALAKICVLSEKFSLEELETPIPIDTSVEDWIKEIEENVRKNRTRRDSFVTTEKTKEGVGIQKGHIENNFINKILKYKDISELKLSF